MLRISLELTKKFSEENLGNFWKQNSDPLKIFQIVDQFQRISQEFPRNQSQEFVLAKFPRNFSKQVTKTGELREIPHFFTWVWAKKSSNEQRFVHLNYFFACVNYFFAHLNFCFAHLHYFLLIWTFHCSTFKLSFWSFELFFCSFELFLVELSLIQWSQNKFFHTVVPKKSFDVFPKKNLIIHKKSVDTVVPKKNLPQNKSFDTVVPQKIFKTVVPPAKLLIK